MSLKNVTQDQLFQLAFDEAVDGMIFIRRDGFLQQANKSFCRMMARTSDELLLKHLNDLLPSEDREVLPFDLTEVLAGQTLVLERRLATADGELRQTEISLKLLAPDIILGTVHDISHRKRTELAIQKAYDELEQRVEERTRDLSAANAALQKEITERQLAEQALQQAYQRLKLLLENSPLMVVEWDHRFRVTYWSEEAERFFGWSLAEVRGKHPKDWRFIHEEDEIAIEGVINRLVEGVDRHNVGLNQNYCKDGSVVHCEWYNSAIFDENGQLISILSLVLDVTLHRRASLGLRESEKRYRRLVELSFDTILVVDENKILYVNPAGSKLLGADRPEDLIGRPNETFIHPDSFAILSSRFQEAYETGGELPLIEARLLRLDGTPIDVELASIQISYYGQPTFQVVIRDISNRKKAVKALLSSEAKFRTLTETTSAAIFIYQGAMNCYVNPMAAIITGYTQEELLAMTFWDIVHPNFRPLVKERGLARQDGQAVPNRYELQIVTKNGPPRWVDTTLGLIEYEGKPAVLGTAFDITERKEVKAEQERLLIAEHNQRLLAETLGEVFLVLTAQTSRQAVLDEILRQMRRLVSYSTANIVLLKDDILRLVRWHGYQDHENTAPLVNMTQSLQDYPLDAEVVRTRQPRVVADTYQAPGWRLEVNRRWIKSYVSVPICLGNQVLGLIRLNGDKPDLFSEDDVKRLLPLAHAAAIALENARLHDQAREEIAERIVIERELRRSEARNHALLDAIPDLIFRISREGRYLDCQEGQSKGATIPSPTDIGKNLREVVPADIADLTLKKIQRTLDSGEVQIFEYQLSLPHDIQDYETRLVVSGPDEVLGIVRNITDRKRAVQQMVHAERLAALGRLAAALAHEMNNPLQIIQSHLDLILDFPLELGERERYLQIIRHEIQRLTEVNRRILSYARPASTTLQEVALADLIDQVLVLTRKRLHQNGIEIVAYMKEVPPILTSPSELTQVFLNLVINAVESTAFGGQITISLWSEKQWAIVTFSNDGQPIPSHVLPHIFEPFYTTKTDGMGLGLWISHSLIEQHGGILVAENLDNNQGVSFTVKIPFVSAAQTQPEMELSDGNRIDYLPH